MARLAATAGVGGGASISGGSGGGQLPNLGAVGETCETLCETSYGETLRFKHEPCTLFKSGRGLGMGEEISSLVAPERCAGTDQPHFRAETVPGELNAVGCCQADLRRLPADLSLVLVVQAPVTCGPARGGTAWPGPNSSRWAMLRPCATYCLSLRSVQQSRRGADWLLDHAAIRKPCGLASGREPQQKHLAGRELFRKDICAAGRIVCTLRRPIRVAKLQMMLTSEGYLSEVDRLASQFG